VNPSATIIVVCTGCHAELDVHSRSEFSSFDDEHRATCQSSTVPFDASLDDLLDLPPS
jgi:hypothetical protein